jgi:hypothetical protein
VWEILRYSFLLFGQFHGFTHQLIGQFQGIPLEKSQPGERTFAGQVTPSKRTFGPVNAPEKPTLRLILHHLALHPHPKLENGKFLDLRISSESLGDQRLRPVGAQFLLANARGGR